MFSTIAYSGAMLRVLTLSTLFPDATRPNFGIFVERQTLGLAAEPDVAVELVSPVSLPPWPARLHPHFRARAALPLTESWKGLRVHRPRVPHLPGPGMRFTPQLIARTLLPQLRALRTRFPFDVIDAEFFWPDGPAAIRLGEALGVPVSIKARGGDIHFWGATAYGQRQIVDAGQRANGLLAVSGALACDMAALGLPAGKIRVHHTGVDLDLFRPQPRKPGPPLLLTAGYLIERKGQALVIDALRHLPDARLLIAGDGPDRPQLTAQIAALGLQNRVSLLGSVPHAELPALFSAADVMVLPSASEGLANVWVEALACGTPIVIPDVGGAREVVDRPAAGRLAPRDPKAIADAVSALIFAPPDRRETRAAAERFTWAANTAALKAHLNGLVNRPGATLNE